MNFRLRSGYSVILMSVRRGAPYADRVEDEGRVLIYEGHDVPRTPGGPDPKRLDQPDRTSNGLLTQNGLFTQAVEKYKQGFTPPELVRVYEKIHAGIWVYNGVFKLVDSWKEQSDGRNVFKFKLELTDIAPEGSPIVPDRDDDRIIPSWVKLEVWNRDNGRCIMCGLGSGLHFDHIIPYSKGGSSKDPKNIQILCGRHNISKRDNIE